MSSKHSLVRLATASALAIGSIALTSTAAHAATTYKVSGTDGTLAEQSQPAQNHVVGWLHEGDSVQVVCQVNNGGQDLGDGGTSPWQQSRTWDKLTNGNWVYDHFITTPAQGSDGYSPGVPHCSGPSSLTTAIAIPSLSIGGISVYGTTAGPIFNDGPGFTNAARAESLATAEASGYCQDLVLANSDFSFLMPDINYVARWPQDARDNGRDVSTTPVVGSVVVFNPGQHLWSATHYWDYGDGHVAVVVKVDSSSYTVAEFNFNLGGGGRHIMSFRRIPWPDPYPNSLGGPSVLAFIR
ncbi:CHAP domain-containing protein [Catenulispora rubra]|uniref:CHAP domain-containing protein n=1 Tax=Catenulispora rubra TaxID=280293 RepID=UPI0018920C98|nr:CHAP domain-containing protein [Catenulispora rubra]